jgi:hypothetical protein
MSESLLILEKLNSLYAGAISQLITYTVGVLAFVGLLIPVFIAALQRRQLKQDHESMLARLSTEVAAAKAELVKSLSEESIQTEERLREALESTKAELKAEMNRANAGHKAHAFHIQAQNLQAGATSRIEDCLLATSNYVIAGDEFNLRTILNVCNGLWKTAKLEDLEHIPNFDEAFNEGLAALRTLNKTGRYSADIQALTSGFNSLKKAAQPV